MKGFDVATGVGESWSILVDSGYQGLQQLVPVVLPHRRPRNGDLSILQRQHNRLLARHRVVCENFYGRMKSKWRILASKYRSDKDSYEQIFRLCTALTNASFNNIEASV